MILLALLQVAAVPSPMTRATSVPPTERFSILAAPCGRAGDKLGEDVVVCGGTADTSRLPLPAERGPPDRPIASNPYLRPDVAMNAGAPPCAARQEGCTTGFGQPLVAAALSGIATAVSDGIADAKVRKARHRDAGKRVPIPLD